MQISTVDNYLGLVDNLVAAEYLKRPIIINAFKKIRRTDFVLAKDREWAHLNEPLSIGYGQTISQPLTVAYMLELLDPGPGDRILDIGSGSGWTVALLSEIVGSSGKVFGIERIPELKKMAEANIGKYNFTTKGIASVICGDGTVGLPKESLFDKIIVAAAAPDIPDPLRQQLKVGGRLVIPVGDQSFGQEMVTVDKKDGHSYDEQKHGNFVFVPLI